MLHIMCDLRKSNNDENAKRRKEKMSVRWKGKEKMSVRWKGRGCDAVCKVPLFNGVD